METRRTTAGKKPFAMPQKIHRDPVEQSTKTTTIPATKHDDTLEIAKKSPDDNLETTHDDNLGFNT